jgi:hypothetical protein
MKQWYHIRLETRDGEIYYIWDKRLSEVKKVIADYRSGEVYVNEKDISKSDIAKFTIRRTYDTSWMIRANKGKRGIDDDALFKTGSDVTNTLLPRRWPRKPLEKKSEVLKEQSKVVYDPKRIFIVHGHDDASKNELATFLFKFGLEPIILREEAKQGRTIIEQFEKHASNVGYAFVMLTPDDAGYKSDSQVRPRARQNVILELGYFWGKLGRGRVCCLSKGEVDPPSDMYGILLLKYKEKVEERFYDISEEVRKAGYKINRE